MKIGLVDNYAKSNKIKISRGILKKEYKKISGLPTHSQANPNKMLISHQIRR